MSRILLTGSQGYVGRVIGPALLRAGHDVVGLDSGLFDSCRFGPEPREHPWYVADVRDVSPAALVGFDAVLHLAALFPDATDDLAGSLVDAVNHQASVRLARLAKLAGVERFVMASSSRVYGSAEGTLAEDAPLSPACPYGRSKAAAETGVAGLAGDDFVVTSLRIADIYGLSPRLRTDLLVNNLVARAVTGGTVSLPGDGSGWRPLVHVEDVGMALRAVLEAPADVVAGQAFNVGRTGENYRLRDVADLVAALAGGEVHVGEPVGIDRHSHLLDCRRLAAEVPEVEFRWTVPAGIQQLRNGLEGVGLTAADFRRGTFARLDELGRHRELGLLRADLRPADTAASGYAA
jgi:nucleoside-diphosphate-sugar epimerase